MVEIHGVAAVWGSAPSTKVNRGRLNLPHGLSSDVRLSMGTSGGAIDVALAKVSCALPQISGSPSFSLRSMASRHLRQCRGSGKLT